MAEPSKILTVSYGTFSCTLEGFEDAFDTMKAIAEYFRDLAADDRYFGAEPPTPDPEMLARIAEREVERRVEARMERGAYVLRPATLTTAAGVAAAGSSTLAAQPSDAAPDTEEPTRSEPVASVEPSAADPQPDETIEAPEGLPEPGHVQDAAAPDMVNEDDAPEWSDTSPASETAAEAEADTAKSDEAPDLPDGNESGAEIDETVLATDAVEAELSDARDVEETAAFVEPREELEGAVESQDVPVSEAVAEAPSEIEPRADGAHLDAEEQARGPFADEDAPAEPALADEKVEQASEDNPASEGGPDPIETKPWEELTADERREFRRRRRAERAAARAAESEQAAQTAKSAGPETETLGETVGEVARAPESQEGDVSAIAHTSDVHEAETTSTPSDENQAPAVEAEEDDSVAAKLARIQAVVGSGAAGALAFATSEEEESSEADPATDHDLASLRSLIRQNEDIARPEATAAETQPAPETEAHATPDSETVAQAPDEAVAAPIRARVVKMRRSDFEARYGESRTEAEDSASMATSDKAPSEEMDQAGNAESQSDLSDAARLDGVQDDGVGPSPSADDADFETDAMLADLGRLDGLEEYEARVAEAAAPASSLSADAEAELLEELAEVERMGLEEEGDLDRADMSFEVQDVAAPSDEAREAADPENRTGESRAMLLAKSPESDEADMSRILTETDAQLNEPEASRRREAIAHLKAAVAATEAARQLGENSRESDEDGENMFRDDLDQVVRPRRTPRPLTRSERPRPAPLKLVASQRVDAPAPAAPAAESRPVAPRRVEAGASVPDASEAAAQERFARFAADMGTTGLTDMIEAAAAHEIFNEGNEDVSRPQLMRMVQAIVPGDFSREDGLRAFGTLLRQGRLEKVRNGRFRVSPQTRFNPRRAASGS